MACAWHWGDTGLPRGRPFPVQKPQCLVCDLSVTEFREGGGGGGPRGSVSNLWGSPSSLLSPPVPERHKGFTISFLLA